MEKHNFKDYANNKLECYFNGDKGALGDLFEAVIKSVLAKRFDYNDVKVSASSADFYSRCGAYEIGHNGKQWNFRSDRDRKRHPRKVIYGVLTLEQFKEIVTLINNDNVTAAQEIAISQSAIFANEDTFLDTMSTLTRGAGFKIAHTQARGDLFMSIYNDSKHKAFLKALNNGTLEKFEGRA